MLYALYTYIGVYNVYIHIIYMYMCVHTYTLYYICVYIIYNFTFKVWSVPNFSLWTYSILTTSDQTEFLFCEMRK